MSNFEFFCANDVNNIAVKQKGVIDMNVHEIDSIVMKRKKELEEILELCGTRLKAAPEGSLRIAHRKGRPQYYLYLGGDKKQVYLGGAERPALLAQKAYDMSVSKLARSELTAIESLISKRKDCTPEAVYELLSQDRQRLIAPVRLSDEEFVREWLAFRYDGKGFAEDASVYITDRGEKVRSKSEVLIANMLLRRKIPYRYECPVKIPGAGTFYPDFHVLNVRLRKEFIHEHFGLMDSPDYADNAVGKISAYARAGIFPGDRLIITSETRKHPLNMQTLNLLIDKYYL